MLNESNQAEDKTAIADVTMPDLLGKGFQGIAMLGRGRKTIASSCVMWILVGIALSYSLPVRYTATTIILPPQQEKGSSAVLASLGSVTGLSGLNGKDNQDMYVKFVKSDVILIGLVKELNLQAQYKTKFMSDAVRRLSDEIQVFGDKKSGLITISVTDKSAEFAAKLCNALPVELGKLLSRVAVTAAQQQVLFFEKQVSDTLNKISRAEQGFDAAKKENGVLSVDTQVTSAMASTERLSSQISAAEVQLATLMSYATRSNPEVEKLQNTISALKTQLQQIQRGAGSESLSDDVRDGDLASLANIRAYRDLKFQQEMLNQLRGQLGMAQIDLAKEGPLVQQIDPATVPERKSAPKRILILIGFGFFGLFWGGGRIWFKETIAADPIFRKRWEAMKKDCRLIKR